MPDDIVGAVVECVPLTGGKPILVEVVSENDGIGVGYRVRRSDLARARQGHQRKRGFAGCGNDLVVVSFGRWTVTKTIQEARRG